MNYEINISADMSENKLNSIRYDIFWHDITLFISADSTNTFFVWIWRVGLYFFPNEVAYLQCFKALKMALVFENNSMTEIQCPLSP